MVSQAKELYREGRLEAAVKAMGEEVERHPIDQSRRGFFVELLCVAGQLERADEQLGAMSEMDPAAAAGIALFRRLVRAETVRQAFFRGDGAPGFLATPSNRLKAHLQASAALRAGDGAEAVKLLELAAQTRRPVSGCCNGAAFKDFLDLDDLTACLFEVLTSAGRYYWVDIDAVESLEFHAPVRPRDLLWRRALLCLREGPDGEVFLPATYADPREEGDDRTRLGRVTDWLGGEGTPVRGLGQRTYLVGDDARSIMEFEKLTFIAG